MLSIKNIAMLLLCVLFALTSTQTATAQEKAKAEVTYTTEQAVTVGDTVMIHKDSLRYLTGEKMSSWVYDKKHTVWQVGTKRFPDGVLLKEIRSWVKPATLLPIAIAAPPVVKEEPVVEEEVEELVAEEPKPTKEDTDSIKKALAAVETDHSVHYEIPVSYNMDRFSIAIRGGFASTLVNGLPLGFDALLDLQYAHYWAAHQEAVKVGIMTGLSAGYVYTHQNGEYVDQFHSGDIDYLVTAVDIDEKMHQVLLELPVMFSMVTPGGFFLNVGPKLMLPVYSPIKQSIEYPNITAYVPELNGEIIKNEVVTGKLTPEQLNLKGRADHELKLAIALGLELGYEIPLKNGHSFGIGAFASCTAYSMYKNTTDGHIISVVAPNDNSAAVVNVNAMTNALAEHIGHLDAGIKLSYNFNFTKD